MPSPTGKVAEGRKRQRERLSRRCDGTLPVGEGKGDVNSSLLTRFRYFQTVNAWFSV